MRVVRNIDIDLIDYDRLPSLKSIESLISHLKELEERYIISFNKEYYEQIQEIYKHFDI